MINVAYVKQLMDKRKLLYQFLWIQSEWEQRRLRFFGERPAGL